MNNGLRGSRLLTTRVNRAVLLAFTSVMLLPAAAWAQGIAGVVRDTSGGLLPGVTVEASSPALIEKVRTVVSDGRGQYIIVDLRPGTYLVTFTLPGFRTVQRPGITLRAGFTASVDVELPVGTLEETVTVSGAAPLVDTQNVAQQEVVSSEMLSNLPSGTKGFMGIARLVPGMSGNADAAGSSGIYSSNSAHTATLHGKGSAKMSYDGMQTSNLSFTGHSSYMMNPATAAETVVETDGISAKSDASGIRINLVPKEGGNDLRFSFDGTFSHENLQNDNLTDELRGRGLSDAGKAHYVLCQSGSI